MKPSDLPKDKQINVRISSELLAELKRRGYTSQKIVDYAVDQLIGPLSIQKPKESK